ncbi:MAG: DUF4160 domain-containing protein [Alphaproteobacteria bacterium]|nr:DUF4160 domain-containing protein [Alphaproteobacteria bacterium]
MATIKRFSKTKISIYAEDHLPPHFHILGVDFDVLVEIETMNIKGKNKRDIKQALEWAEENKDLLMSKWKQLNER